METDLNNMTMRDLFAAFAMMGRLASGNQNSFGDGDIAYTAYQLADEMIEQRSIDATEL